MTVILDPGNAPNSYTDGVSRPWPTTAGLWKNKDATDLANYNSEVTLYNNEVTAFNNLQSGLNNPDGLTSVAMNWPTLPDNGASGTTFTLTIPRNGHYLIAVVIDATCALNSFGDGITFTCSGIIAQSKVSNNGWNNNGTMSIGAGFYAHGDYTTAQSVTVSISTGFIVGASSSATGIILAHFTPDATHHN